MMVEGILRESYISVSSLESILASYHHFVSVYRCHLLVVVVSVGVVSLVCCICVLHMRVGRYASRVCRLLCGVLDGEFT